MSAGDGSARFGGGFATPGSLGVGLGVGGALLGGLGGPPNPKPNLLTHPQHFPNPPAAAGQRLKVEDALSYLDQVKIQFASRPQVYSDFLDIMKDFKSQTIDTPGVIQRVSSLFRGHPSLIVGFNTFLPMGYKIEVDGEHGERVSISTPNGQSHIITQGGEKMRTLDREEAQLAAAEAALAVNRDPAPGPPLEFNHAINYVNKIKSRFQHKPQVYKQFLEILHTYQKEQRDLKAGSLGQSQKTQTESQVYECVAKLFSDESDLLKEFSQFLPDAGMMSLGAGTAVLGALPTSAEVKLEAGTALKRPASVTAPKAPKKLGSPSGEPSPKRPRPPAPIVYDVPTDEAAKHCTLEEFQFFDKVRKGFRSDVVYENFLRTLVLYNLSLITKGELLELSYSFLGKFPELLKWLTEFLGCSERPEPGDEERISSDLALEIDYASCKRYGVSYRALPASYTQPKASGRTQLCDQVLNDTWVSFPSWSSEDSSCVSSKKTLYEEHIYKTEDERFELDIVVEVNRSAIQALEGLSRRLGSLSDAEAKAKTESVVSPPLLQRAVRRIYGERAADIVDGLRRNPGVAVPLVLKRLKAKEEEWREAQKGFNRLWREQNDKYYLKSLDQQSLTFKQNDLKALKSKVLINQVEVLYDERHEKGEETGLDQSGPHLSLAYPSRRAIIYDVSDLLIHHVKRQPSVQKEDKVRMKKFLKQTLAELLGLRRQDLSDEEDESEGAEEEEGRGRRRRAQPPAPSPAVPSLALPHDPDPGYGYSLIFVPNSTYVFLRLHLLLTQRLARLHDYASALAAQSIPDPSKPPSAAAILKALPKPSCEPSEYYSNLLTQVKNLLDGAVDSAQYEDNLREMFTTQAYTAFTMDKIVQTMVRQLSVMVTDSTSVSALSEYERWAAEGGAGGPGFVSNRRQEKEDAYQAAAENLMTDQNCFKIIFKEETGEMSVELVDTDGVGDEGREEWGAYVASFVQSSSKTLSAEENKSLLGKMADKPILLYRQVRGKSWDGADSSVSVSEGLEMSWVEGAVKPKFVAGTGDVFYRRDALGRGLRSTSAPLTGRRRRRWSSWAEGWRGRHCEATAEEDCQAWLLRSSESATAGPPPSLPDPRRRFGHLEATVYSTPPP